ncbi:MAG: peptidoglycan editing factor PgeF [Candidatus Competibacteraceae bacterium]|nr:peptidoglycan editing factor PgeF [Candidatus Competibacteraceae bacterium]
MILRFPHFDSIPWITHGFTSRQDGFSIPPFHSFNMGLHVGDQVDHVMQNRNKFAQQLQIQLRSLYYANQIHSDKIFIVTEPIQTHPHPSADALITDLPGTAVAVMSADCVPILLADTQNRVVAAVHAGWKGSVNAILLKTLLKMQKLWGSKPSDIMAGIGPCISYSHYEVGHNVIEIVTNVFPQSESLLSPSTNNKMFFNLTKANMYWLHLFGMHDSQIAISNYCTYSDSEKWFSARRNPITGRMASAIGIRP